MNIINLIANLLHKIANKIENESYSQNYCVSSGNGCRFTSNTTILNHPQNPEAIQLGDGVLIDGILEVYNQGNLLIDDYSYIGNYRIFCAVKVSIVKAAGLQIMFLLWIAIFTLSLPSNVYKTLSNFQK